MADEKAQKVDLTPISRFCPAIRSVLASDTGKYQVLLGRFY
jgi:hypothetical protein